MSDDSGDAIGCMISPRAQWITFSTRDQGVPQSQTEANPPTPRGREKEQKLTRAKQVQYSKIKYNTANERRQHKDAWTSFLSKWEWTIK